MRRRSLAGRRPYAAGDIIAALAPTAWWKADDLALSDGDAVSSWADASGHGWTLTQATPLKQPTYKAAGINGKPAVLGSATNVTALATVTTIPAMNGPYTVYIAGKAPTTTPAAIQYLTGGNSSGSRRDVYRNTNRTFGLQGSSGNNGSITAPGDTGFIVGGIFDGASSLIRHDSIPLPGSSGNTGASSPVQIILGARNGQTSSFDGWIGEVLFIPRRLTDVETMRLEKYLSRKWGIPLTQPGVMYVNTTTGSDTANTGRTPSSPLATATKANNILSTGSGRIEVTGTLREALVIGNSFGDRLINLAPGTTWYGSERHTSGWASVGSGVYSKSVTGYDTTVNHARVVTDLDSDGFWTTLFPAASPTAPAAGEIGFSGGTLYVHLAGNADPNTKTIEIPKYRNCIASQTAQPVVIRGGTVLCANGSNIVAGSAGTDGNIIVFDNISGYAGEGCHATQADASSFKRYRSETYRSMNDGGNWHSTRAGGTTVYSEDCNDHHNYDEGESAHETAVVITHTVRGGWKHHNVGGGGITNVGISVLDADGSAAGPLIIENNHTGSLNTREGGISAYESTTKAVIGPNVIMRNNNGPGYYFEPGPSTGRAIDPAAVAAATGNANPNVGP